MAERNPYLSEVLLPKIFLKDFEALAQFKSYSDLVVLYCNKFAFFAGRGML